MNISEIKNCRKLEAWLVPTAGNEAMLSPGYAEINLTENEQRYEVIQNGKVHIFSLRDKSKRNEIDRVLSIDNAKLSAIDAVAKDGSVLLRVFIFNGPVVDLGDIEVGIADHIKKAAKESSLKSDSIADLSELLMQKFQIGPLGGHYYYMITAGAAAVSDFLEKEIKKKEPEEQEDGAEEDILDDILDQPEQNEKKEDLLCFSIRGDGLQIPVEKRPVAGVGEIFFASKLINRVNRNEDPAIMLVRGKLTFSDFTLTGKIKAIAAGEMSRILEDKESYLRKWDEYGRIEGELLLEEARAIGTLRFNNPVKVRNGVKLFLHDPVPPALTEDMELEFVDEAPVYIRNARMQWQEYSEMLHEEYLRHRGEEKLQQNSTNPEQEVPEEAEQSEDRLSGSYRIIDIGEGSITLDIPVIPTTDRLLCLSIAGDKVQIQRQIDARERIKESRGANPLLGAIIEEKGNPPSVKKRSNHKALTPYVKKKFKNEPTPMQIKAIEIALNTPDIALIQGPPGTGKTTVITAIIERLNEMHDKTGGIKGEILVSGFQHDAVENITNRLRVNSLPVIKYGRRSGETSSAAEIANERVYQWCNSLAAKIREKNPDIVQSEQQKALFRYFQQYMLSPSRHQAIDLLNRIISFPADTVSENIVKRAKALIEEMESETDESRDMESALSLAMALPVQEESFRDGGADRAADIFKRLNKSLQPAEKTLLQKAVIWEDGKDLSFLKDLRRLRLNLLKKFTPKPEFKVEKGREEVISLVTEALADMERRNIKSGSRTDAIIAEFLNELENNPYGVLNSVSEYNYVFAATAQQAAGKDVRRAKTEFGKSQKDTIVSFDTVIIDEAARTSPRDLLIPMVQARNRIILVGDHKQLPHILNETVVKGMNIEDDEDFIKKSMFRYLIERARKLEEIDRIPRTVTLDAQYRMHPLLGDFVSRQFYEKDGEGFRSPLSEDLFAHNLPDTNNKPAVWLEVPAEDGQEGKAGTSRIRKAEARKIAQKLSKWMDSESGKGLSYGVISFYKAQCNQISEALAEYGITERAGEGEWAIKDEYQFLKEKEGKQPEERLRIGTVDAFQGMEFDVVFLSMVRSKREHHTDPQKPEGNEKTRIFGHLISLNRLCVSLSRQKKLLVIVGDSKMLQTNTAKAAVPALCDFYELCKTKGMIL